MAVGAGWGVAVGVAVGAQVGWVAGSMVGMARRALSRRAWDLRAGAPRSIRERRRPAWRPSDGGAGCVAGAHCTPQGHGELAAEGRCAGGGAQAADDLRPQPEGLYRAPARGLGGCGAGPGGVMRRAAAVDARPGAGYPRRRPRPTGRAISCQPGTRAAGFQAARP